MTFTREREMVIEKSKLLELFESRRKENVKNFSIINKKNHDIFFLKTLSIDNPNIDPMLESDGEEGVVHEKGKLEPEASDKNDFLRSIFSASDIFSFSASSILYDLGIDNPDEVDIGAVLSYCGAMFIEKEMDLQIPYLLRKISGQGVIFLNKNMNNYEQRYYCMFALAEWNKLAATKRIDSSIHTGVKTLTEYLHFTEKSTFRKKALDFLIPKQFLLDEIKDFIPSLINLKELANKVNADVFMTSLAYLYKTKRKCLLFCIDKSNGKKFWYEKSSTTDVYAKLKKKVDNEKSEEYKKLKEKFIHRLKASSITEFVTKELFNTTPSITTFDYQDKKIKIFY